MIAGGRAYKLPDATKESFPAYAAQVHIATCGELSCTDTIKGLRKHQELGRYENSAYLGFAGFLNLTYIAAAKPATAILADINPFQTQFWERTIDMMAALPELPDFMNYVRNLEPILEQTISQVHMVGPYELGANYANTLSNPVEVLPIRALLPFQDWLKEEDTPDLHWIKDGYDHLHSMAKQGKIGAVTIDVTDNAAWAQLDQHLNDQNLRVGIAYVSNVYNFVGARTWRERIDTMESHKRAPIQTQNAINNLARLLEDTPTIIDRSNKHLLSETLSKHQPIIIPRFAL